MLKGFKDFVLRGNVIDLAVGVVIGVAFNDFVSSITDSMLRPLIALAGGGGELSGEWVIQGQHFAWAKVINSLITLAITAAVLYFIVVLPMNKLNDLSKRRNGDGEATPAELTELQLLTEIRDALVKGERATVPRQPLE